MRFPIAKLTFHLRNAAAMLVGAAIFSFSINYFNIANGLAEGGFTGIALTLNALFGFPPGWFLLLANIPLFLMSFKILSLRSFVYTIFATTAVSVFLELFKGYGEAMPGDLFLAALFAGAGVGVGLGLIFRYGGTTGGTDIIARIVHKYWGISIGKTLFAFDFVVIAVSMAAYLDRERAMYTLVCVYLGSRIIDIVQEGASAAKAVTIISDQSGAISHAIMHEMERGATILNGMGAYTGSAREVIYCVIGRNEIVRIKALVHRVDPHAFVVVSDAREVRGEGFTLNEHKQPIE